MSDNPNEEELASLGINFDSQAFAADIQAAQAQVEQFGASAAEALTQANTAAQALTETMNTGAAQAVQSQQSLNEVLKETQERLAFIQEQQQSSVDAQGFTAAGRESYAQYRGYGVDEGMIGPAEAPDAGEIGSLSGAARGLRGVSPDAAKALYLVQGLRSISEILPELNAAAEATPSLLTPLASGLTAVGVPMAGLVAVALPVAAALGGMLLAIKSFVDMIKSGAEGIASDVQQLQHQGKLAGTGTSSSLAADRDKLIAENGGNDTALTQLKNQREAMNALLDEANRGESVNIPALAAAKALDGQIADLTKTIDENKAKINDYNQAIESQQVVFNDAAEAARASADAIMEQQQAYAKFDSMTVEQVNGTVAQLQGEQRARELAMKTIEANTQLLEATNDESGKNNYQIGLNKAKLAELNDEYDVTADKITHLTDVSKGLAQAADEWAQHEQDLADAGKKAAEVEKERVDLTKQLADAEADLVKQEADAKQKELQQEQQYTIGFDQDTQARLEITTKASRQETQIKEQMAQADEDIRTKLKNSLDKASTDLSRQTEDDATKYTNDRAKMIRQEHDQEVGNLQDHLQKLSSIQNQTQHSDQQALLDRNFLALAKNKEGNQQQIDQENTRYAQQQANQRTHLAQQEREQDIAFAQEQVKRKLDYERKRDDLELAAQHEFSQQRTNEERKLTAQRLAEAQSLSDLTLNEQYKLRLLRSGLQTELQLLQEQEKQRIAIIQQSMAALGATHPTGSGAGTAGGPTRVLPFRDGGDFAAGQPFEFNESGSSGFERVKIGSTSFGANTAALVIPFGSGSVDANKGGGKNIQMYNTWQISGSGVDADRIVNLAVGKMQDMLESVINQ